jgi:hypothetical protein
MVRDGSRFPSGTSQPRVRSNTHQPYGRRASDYRPALSKNTHINYSIADVPFALYQPRGSRGLSPSAPTEGDGLYVGLPAGTLVSAPPLLSCSGALGAGAATQAIGRPSD